MACFKVSISPMFTHLRADGTYTINRHALNQCVLVRKPYPAISMSMVCSCVRTSVSMFAIKHVIDTKTVQYCIIGCGQRGRLGSGFPDWGFVLCICKAMA